MNELLQELQAAQAVVHDLYNHQWPGPEASEAEQEQFQSRLTAAEERASQAWRELENRWNDWLDEIDQQESGFTNLTSHAGHGNRFVNRAEWESFVQSVQQRALELQQARQPLYRMAGQAQQTVDLLAWRSPRYGIQVPEYDWRQVNEWDNQNRRWVGGRDDGQWVKDG